MKARYVIVTDYNELLECAYVLGWDDEYNDYVIIDGNELIALNGDLMHVSFGSIDTNENCSAYVCSTLDIASNIANMVRTAAGYGCCVCKIDRDDRGLILIQVEDENGNKTL